MGKSPTAKKHYDRNREVTTFLEVLTEASAPRIITVVDGEGQGKSWLLEHLEGIADRVDPPAATCRVIVKDDPELIWLVEQISSGLTSSGAPLNEFQRLNLARGTWDREAFGLPAPPSPRTAVNIVNSALHNSPTTGGEFTTALEGWPDGHEHAAQQACLDALLDDLRDLSRTRTVVVLIDQFERATDPIESWLTGALLNRVLSADDPFGHFVLVMASSRVVLPKLANQLGHRRRQELLRPIEGLSRWEDEHIGEWARDRGLNQTIWIPAIRDLLDRGGSLQTLRMLGAAGRKELADAGG